MAVIKTIGLLKMSWNVNSLILPLLNEFCFDIAANHNQYQWLEIKCN